MEKDLKATLFILFERHNIKSTVLDLKWKRAGSYFLFSQVIGDPLTPGPPEVPLQPPSPFLIVANKFLGGELKLKITKHENKNQNRLIGMFKLPLKIKVVAMVTLDIFLHLHSLQAQWSSMSGARGTRWDGTPWTSSPPPDWADSGTASLTGVRVTLLSTQSQMDIFRTDPDLRLLLSRGSWILFWPLSS